MVAADTTEALDDDDETKWRSLLASLSAKVVVLRNWGRGNDEFLADFVVVVVVLDVVATVAALVPLNTSSNNCDADLINFLRGCCCCCGGGEGSFVTKGWQFSLGILPLVVVDFFLTDCFTVLVLFIQLLVLLAFLEETCCCCSSSSWIR